MENWCARLSHLQEGKESGLSPVAPTVSLSPFLPSSSPFPGLVVCCKGPRPRLRTKMRKPVLGIGKKQALGRQLGPWPWEEAGRADRVLHSLGRGGAGELQSLTPKVPSTALLPYAKEV